MSDYDFDEGDHQFNMIANAIVKTDEEGIQYYGLDLNK